jgi:fumarate reductase subunit D
MTRSWPSLPHLFFWFMFAQGGVLAAILIPVHVLVQGILGPLGIVPVADRRLGPWLTLLGNPLVKIYIVVLIAFPFFHFAHRLRYLLVDLGVPAAKSVPAQVVFYGGAVLVTLAAIYIVLTTAPLHF